MANILSKANGNFTDVASWCNPAAGAGASQMTVSASSAGIASMVWSTAFTVTTGQVITGVWMYCSGSIIGTCRVALSENNGTTETRYVTVNATDLPRVASWVFFKFSSTLTADGGSDYKVGWYSSYNPNATVYRDGTAGNWAHMLGTSADAGALAAADVFNISGELTGAGTHNDITITMDNTDNTDWGAITIGINGVLDFGTTASTNYYLKTSGMMNVFGTLNIGTTGTPIPRTSTAVLEFDVTSDGEFGLRIENSGVFNSQGLSRTSGKDVVSCKLNTDEAVAQTVLGVDIDTGWLSGDEIGIAPTQRVIAQYEKRVLDGNASATEVTVTAGLTYAHDGTGNLQADVILLTRNVKIRSATSTLMTYVYLGTTSTVDIDWTEFYYLGANTAGKRGLEIATTTGSCNIQNSSIHDCEYWGVYLVGSANNNITFSYNVMYNLNVNGTAALHGLIVPTTSGTSITISNNIMIGVTGSTSNGFHILDVGITFTNNVTYGVPQYGAYLFENASATGTFSALKAYCCSVGFYISSVNSLSFQDIETKRNTQSGFAIASNRNCTFNNLTSIGNTNRNLELSGNGSNYLVSFDNLILKAEASYNTLAGISIGSDVVEFYITNSSIGETTGHTNGDITFITCYAKIYLHNTILASSTEVLYYNAIVGDPGDCFIASAKHDATTATHKTWFKCGIIEYTTSVPATWTSPCLKMTPESASLKMASAPLGMGMKCAVDSSSTVTVSVKVQKSASYNGNQPRLIVRKNVAAGISADTVLDTMTAAVSTDETLSGTTASVTDDAVLEFIIDCDGTAGVVYIDDWAVS